jgi:hypothetical protein
MISVGPEYNNEMTMLGLPAVVSGSSSCDNDAASEPVVGGLVDVGDVDDGGAFFSSFGALI